MVPSAGTQPKRALAVGAAGGPGRGGGGCADPDMGGGGCRHRASPSPTGGRLVGGAWRESGTVDTGQRVEGGYKSWDLVSSAKNDAQLGSCEFSFIWGKMRTAAREAAPQIALIACSEEAVGEGQYIRFC